MGTQISTQVNKVMQTIENTSRTSCKSQSLIDQSIQGLNVDFSNAKCGDIVISNKAKAGSVCDLGAMAASLAQASMELNTQQTQGLGLPGISISTSVADRTNIMKQILESSCGSEQAIKQQINNVTFRFGEGASCNSLKFINDADVTTQCVAKVAAEALSKSQDVIKTTQTNDIGLLFPLLILGGILLFVGILYGIYKYMTREQTEEGEDEESGDVEGEENTDETPTEETATNETPTDETNNLAHVRRRNSLAANAKRLYGMQAALYKYAKTLE